MNEGLLEWILFHAVSVSWTSKKNPKQIQTLEFCVTCVDTYPSRSGYIASGVSVRMWYQGTGEFNTKYLAVTIPLFSDKIPAADF